MDTIDAWYSSSDAQHHLHPDCEVGRSVRQSGALPGTGGLPLCNVCKELVEAAKEIEKLPSEG
jgi:hypothetical protein